MFRKKSLVGSLLVAGALLSLAACGGSKKEDTATKEVKLPDIADR